MARHPAVHTETKTQKWLSRPNMGRALLGKELLQLAYTSTCKRALQTITHTYPTQTSLHRWKKATTLVCQLCERGEPENLAHLQCSCPATKEARIAAHHAMWRSLVTKIKAHTSATESVVLTEVTLASLARLGANLPLQRAAQGEWATALANIVEDR